MRLTTSTISLLVFCSSVFAAGTTSGTKAEPAATLKCKSETVVMLQNFKRSALTVKATTTQGTYELNAKEHRLILKFPKNDLEVHNAIMANMSKIDQFISACNARIINYKLKTDSASAQYNPDTDSNSSPQFNLPGVKIEIPGVKEKASLAVNFDPTNNGAVFRDYIAEFKLTDEELRRYQNPASIAGGLRLRFNID